MTVRELKEKLDQYNNDMEVVVTSSNFELNNSLVTINGIYKSKMKESRETFKDAFDYSYYSEKVYVSSENGKDVLVIYG